MKKLLCVAIALVCAVTLQAQEEEKDVTKFLGIPVDGYKPAMIEKLKAKGFIPTSIDKEVLEGEFNGTDVYVYVGTNNNKVYRIMVADKNNRGETDIKIRFNKLCRQFENNPRYRSFSEDQTIPEDEDISYEMTVNNKRYQASFYQKPLIDSTLSIKIAEKAKSDLLTKYTIEEISNPSDEINSEIINLIAKYTADLVMKKNVWFMISEYSEGYRILMFYENKNNEANGEDL